MHYKSKAVAVVGQVVTSTSTIDDKNIDLQIKKQKYMFLKLLLKNIIKTWIKNIKLQMFPIDTFFAIIHTKNI